jgi:dTMP kinase
VDVSIERISGRDLIRRGPFARLWWSQLVSSLGDWATLFATFSLAARISGGGSNATLGILVALVARILPGLLFGVIGGVLADRWDRKRTMVVADFGRATLVLLLVFVGNFRDLFVLTFFIEVLSLVRQPARESVVPHLIPERHLMAANGLNLIASYGTAPVGSALFALFAAVGERYLPDSIANPGVAAAFAFDGITFIASGLIVLTIPVPPLVLSKEREPHGKLDIRAALRDMLDGFKFVGSYPAVRRLVTGMAAGLFGGGALFVLGQPFAEQVLQGNNSGYGIMVTALGVGAGLGMGAMTFWGKSIERREPVFALALIVTGLAIVATGLASTVWGASGWVLAAGFGTGVAYVTGFTQLHTVVTDDIRGRTFAALFASARLALLVSFGLAGVGAAALDGILPGFLDSGVRVVIVLSGAFILASGAGTMWSVRDQLRGGPIDDEAYRALHDAGSAIGWFRGDRRPK